MRNFKNKPEQKTNIKTKVTFQSIMKHIQKTIYLIITSFNLIFKVLFILILIGLIALLILWSYIKPIYTQAQTEAYEALSNIDASTFQLLSDTVVYDNNGDKIGQIASVDYVHADISNISDMIQQAYIASEDRRFLEHNGIDLQGLSRAAVSLVLNKGAITQGGSTITQQVVKNCLLTQEQSYSRKIAELLIAPSIEEKFSKSEIMEIYCNTNYYGNNCYGVESACQYYFGKGADEINLAEAAMIVGISNSPNKYNPEENLELAKEKTASVLSDMKDIGYITGDEEKEALDYNYTLVCEHPSKIDDSSYASSYAIYCAALELMKKDGFTFQYVFDSTETEDAYNDSYSVAYKEKSEEIRAGGYKIYTSLDMSMQDKLQNSVDDTLSEFKEKQENEKYALQSAAVCVDNETGYVVAIVGGRGTSDEYNRAFLSDRQPGSTIKPLLDYAPAIDCGLVTGSTIMTDEKTYAIEGDTSSYSPKNYTREYQGAITVRDALAKSVNTIAFQLFLKIGNKQALSYLNNLKFNSLTYADNEADAVSIGGFTYGVRVVDMAKGYATLANNGVYIDRTCITKIEHETNGNICNYENSDSVDTQQVYSSDTAFIVTDMLEGCVNETYGTAHQYKDDTQVYAAKTGTTNSNKDAWFCGYSGYYSTAVWIGYDTPKEMEGMTGNSYPGQIWNTFMEDIHSDLSTKDFTAPTSVELKKIDEDGNATNEVVEYKVAKLQYDCRPEDADYVATTNQEAVDEWNKEQGLLVSKKAAEKAVSSFEKFTFESLDDVEKLDEKYEAVLAVIDEITDEYEQEPYKKRASAKYESLSGEISEKWKTALEESEANRLEEIDEQNKVIADNAENEAEESLKQTRIDKIKWYLQEINSRSYYNDATRELIAAAKDALERLQGYDEYNQYSGELSDAENQAKQLPKSVETPDIPRDAEDNKTIDQNKYIDTQNEDKNLKQTRINKMQEYLSLLKERTQNDTSTQQLLTDAKSALERLQGYDEYETYKSELDTVEQQIAELPS